MNAIDLQKELCHVSDLLDSRGLEEGDNIYLSPLFGRKRGFRLNRSRIDFVSNNLPINARGNYHKVLDTLDKEKLHYRLEAVRTLGRSRQPKLRYRLRTIEGSPFRHNGAFANEVFLEKGDRVDMGHNGLEIKAAKECESQLDFIDQDSMRIIKSNLPVLITGETGTGKTTLAKKIHELSREGAPFVHLNLSSFSKNLIESELFGHVKGAFTGALNDKQGALREAGKGTLFLDEIDSLSPEIQTKLLIFLDEFKVRPVGGGSDRKAECRLICASGSNLKTAVKNEKMRRDFFYRIASGLNVSLPSLRYNEDLVEKLCGRFSMEQKVSMEPGLIEFYKSLPWPGNIRQLYGHLNKKVVTSSGSKLTYDRHDEALGGESSDLSHLSFDEEDCATLEEVKQEYVKAMYFRCGRNAQATAKRLAISPKSVKNILEKSAS